MRSVHLFDPERAGWVGGAALRAKQACETPEDRSTVVLLGGRRAERDARAYGIRWDARVAHPCGLAWLGWPRVRAILHEPSDVWTHVWSDEGERLARLARPGCRIVREHDGLSTARAERETYGSRDRASMLSRWRLSRQTSIVGVLADRTGSVACEDVSFLLGVLTLAGWPSVAVVWRGAARSVERAERMIRAQGRRWRIIIEDEPLPRWIGGCDVGVAPASVGACPASVSWGVVRETPLVVERVGDMDDGTIVPAGVRVVRAGVRHACAGAALDVLEHLPRER
ncbi:MAG: hypothetical protein AB7G17_05505 [Phycisphaerales bacterium]